mgnify:CR=1 FL=1
MNEYQLNTQQIKFLSWVNRNYEWLRSKGFEPPIQSFPHWVHGVLIMGWYNEDDKFYINYTIKFIKAMGLKTFNPNWIWDKNGPELDWLVNISQHKARFVNHLAYSPSTRCGNALTQIWKPKKLGLAS